MSNPGFYEKPDVLKEYDSVKIYIPVYPSPEEEEKEGKGAMYINSDHYLLAALDYCYGIIRNNLSLSAVLSDNRDEDALLTGSNIELFKRLLLLYRNALIYDLALPRKLLDILYEKNYRGSGELSVIISRLLDPNREHITIECLRTNTDPADKTEEAAEQDEFRTAWANYEKGRQFFNGFEGFYESYWKKQRVLEKEKREKEQKEASGTYSYGASWNY